MKVNQCERGEDTCGRGGGERRKGSLAGDGRKGSGRKKGAEGGSGRTKERNPRGMRSGLDASSAGTGSPPMDVSFFLSLSLHPLFTPASPLVVVFIFFLLHFVR